MSGSRKNTSGGPAHWVAGQRRKLVRRNRSISGPPRSVTMPVLRPSSAASSILNGNEGMGPSHARDGQAKVTQEQHQHTDSGGFPYPAQSVRSSPSLDSTANFRAPRTPVTWDPARSPPRLIPNDMKKRQRIFGAKKPKALDRPQRQVATSPLPVSTPSKAVKFFGLETSPTATGSPRRSRPRDDHMVVYDVPDGDSVGPALRQQHSLPMLTVSKTGAERQIWIQEHDIAPRSSGTTITNEEGTTKALRMLNPEFPSTRLSAIEQTAPAPPRFTLAKDSDVSNVKHSDASSSVPRFRIPAAPRPAPPVPKRHRMRRRGPKDFERMSPITEASSESLRPAYRKAAATTELSAIAEHAVYNVVRNTSELPRPCNETTPRSCDVFELDKNDLSPTDESYDENASVSSEEDVVYPGGKVDLKQARRQDQNAFYLQSPLQLTEHTYLDALEEQMRLEAYLRATEEAMRLEARKLTLEKIEGQKQNVDAAIEMLRRGHERLRLDFCTDDRPGSHHAYQELEGPTNPKLRTSNGSIDITEEPPLNKAEIVKLTGVPAGTVKLVQIPPRKKKSISYVGSSFPVPDRLSLIKHERKSVENQSPISPLTTHYHHEDPTSTTKTRKLKMTRDESRLLVQNWVSDYNKTEQRPLSTRVDVDVLADQETPPAPFPKTDEALLTCGIDKKPPKTSVKLPATLQKHQCVHNGHIFHPIDLRTIPDDTFINNLEVRPYLKTYTGIKQHVKIPVSCEKCGKDCNEDVWECEIDVCRMVTCQRCAEEMEAEWQERAVNGWKYR